MEFVCLALLLVTVAFLIRAHTSRGGKLTSAGDAAAQDGGAIAEAAENASSPTTPRGKASLSPGSTGAAGLEGEDADGEYGLDEAERVAEQARRISVPGASASPADRTALAGNAAAAPVTPSRSDARKTARASGSKRTPTVEEFLKTLEQLEDQPWNAQTAEQLQSTLLQWARQDPAAALGYTLALDSRKTRLSTMQSILREWCKSDPQGAFSWASTNLRNEDPGTFSTALRPIFETLAAGDISGTTETALQLPEGSARTTAIRAILSRAVRTGQQQEVMARLAGTVSPTEFQAYATAVVQEWGAADPSAAATWVLSLSDPATRSAALGSMVSSWVSDRPDTAAQWVSGLPAGTERNTAMNQLTRSWASFDPVGAADWLLTQHPPAQSLDTAIQGLTSVVMSSNPEGAMIWASNITSASQRNSLMEQAGRLWLRRDPDRATAYITASSLPPQIQRRLLQTRH